MAGVSNLLVSNTWSIDRTRATWWALGFVLAATVGLVIWQFIGTFIFGLFVYYATRPVYRRVKRRIGQPSIAAGLAVMTLILPVIFLFSYTVAIALQEVENLLEAYGSDGPIAEVLEPYIDVSSVVQNPQQILESESLRAVLESSARQAVDYVGFIGNGGLHLFVMVAIGFYLLRDDHRLGNWFYDHFDDDTGLVRDYAKAVDRDLSNIFFGNILNAFLTGIIGGLSYNILDVTAPAGLGVPYATLLGVLTGAASLIPVVGMKLVYVPMTAYLLYDAGMAGSEFLWFPVAFAVVSFIIVDTIPDFVLRPYVSGRGLHIGTVMFAYILGPLFFGWPGIFLGPVILVLLVHFVRRVLPELLSGAALSAGTPINSDGGELADSTAQQDTPEPSSDTSASAEGSKNEDEPDSRSE